MASFRKRFSDMQDLLMACSWYVNAAAILYAFGGAHCKKVAALFVQPILLTAENLHPVSP
jgi:hypothetical protein